uniref:Uncharacterized protein n=1 Tax=Amphimedon queenslandica TaxID=400682 RepID=A0A1X7URX4_AMPQE
MAKLLLALAVAQMLNVATVAGEILQIEVNGESVSPYFEESTFVNNTIKYTKYYGTPTGIGAVYTDSVPLNFTGNNNFSGNVGSALVALDATVEFRNNSRTYFEGNEGLSGGAVTLFSKAFLLFGGNCSTVFHNNSATLHGGAISWQSVGDHQLISSRNCFIRYYNTSADPTDWNVTFNFDGNKAGFSGDAIYATSLLGCLWGGKSYGSLYNDTKKEYLTVFCWNNKTKIWNYNSECNSTNSTNLIATSPAYYSNETNGTQCGKYEQYNISVVPGKPTKLDSVMMLDDRQNRISQDSVVYMYTTWNNETKKNETRYVTNEALPYNITSKIIDLGTVIPRVMATTVNLSFTSCPPGFSNEQYGEPCKRGNLPFVNIYSNFSADIQFGYWIGKIGDDDSRYYVGECYFCPWNITTINGSHVVHQNYIHLPENETQLDSFLCGGLNRTGTLCAKFNVLSLYSRHQQAVNIPLSKITFYSQIILIFIPLAYFTLYSIYFIIRNVFRCRRRCNIGPDDDKNEDETFNNFMNDVEEENRLETNHYYGSISDDEDAGQQRRRENEALFNRPSPDSVQFRSRRGRTEPLRSRYMPRRT